MMITAEQIGNMREAAIEAVWMARADAADPLDASDLDEVERLYGPTSATPEEREAWRAHAAAELGA